MSIAIDVRALRKRSGRVRALLGIPQATSGQAELSDRNPWTDAVLHREIACEPGDVTLWPSLTGGEIIDLLARMRGALADAEAMAGRRGCLPTRLPTRVSC